MHAILRKAFNDAVDVEQLLTSNPAERAKRPRREVEGPGTVWSADELRTFLAAAKGHRLYALFHLAAFTGARRGELLNLRWADLDLDGLEVTIRGSAAVIAGVRIEGTTKSGRTRVVSIDAGTAAALKLHRERQEAMPRRLAPPGSARATSSRRGSGCRSSRTRRRSSWRSSSTRTTTRPPRAARPPPPRAAEAAEPLPHARFHDLRHVHATMLLLAGVPVHVVAERLGHADPSITRVYAHVIRRHAAGVADLFAGLLEDPEDEE